MKRKGKYLAAVALCIVLIVGGGVPAFAADGFGGDRGDFWDGGAIHPGQQMTEVSYDALSELCIVQNQLIYEGVYDDVSPFSDTDYELSASVVFDSSENVYVIAVEYAGVQYKLRNYSGMIYFARYQDGGILNTIRVLIDNMYTRVVNINNALTQKDGLFDLWFSLFNERMAYIGTGIDLINANLEDLTITGDVTFDITPITNKLQQMHNTIAEISNRLIADDIPIANAVNRIRLIMLDIPGYIDGIESTLTTISSRLNTQNGYVDGVEGLLSNVVTAVNDVEGWMDDLQTTMVNNSVDALNQQLDVKDELIQFMESTAADRDVLLCTIVDKMDDMGFTLDVDSLNIEGISFDTSPITDAIENYHADFNEYFAQFGENIDYGEKQLSFSGTQEYYWDSDNQSYLSGTLTDGSSVTVYRVPDVTDGLSGVTSGYPRVVDRDGLPMILPTTADRFPGMLNFIYDGVRQQISFDGVYGGGYASGQSFVVDDAAAGSSIYRVEFYGKTTQAGVPSPSSPVSLENVRSYEYYDGYVVGLDIEDRDGRQSNTVFAPAPSYGLRGIPVNSGGNYTDENGQQWLCDVVDSEFGLHIQKVGAITFDGSDDENWRSYTWGQTGYYIVVPGMSLDFVKLAQCGALSTHFPYSHMINQASSGIGFKLSNTSGENVAPVFCCSELFPDLASFKTWLQSNPVTVYYPLAEPVYTELSYPTDFDENYRSGEAYEPQTHFDADCPVTVYYKAVDPVTSIYADADGDWHYGYKSGTSARVDRAAALSVLRDAFNVRTYTDADSVMFNEGKNYITVTNDGQFDITVLQGNKIIMWYVNWAHSSRSWLDGRLNAMQLTPVLQRMDTVISLLSGSVGSGSCEHIYASEVNQEASCALPGLQTFTCSNCGSSYSEIIPSTGHDWQCTDHVADELDPDTGEVVVAGYDIYTCSICGEKYNDYDGAGAPDTQSDTVAGIISRVFEKIGTLVGDLIAMVIRMLDKLLTGFDDLVTDFNTKTEQITGFGGDYPQWLAGVWEIVPSDLQLALGFCVVVGILAILGKKLVFS